MSHTLNHRSILIVVLTMALPSLAVACLWDHDTIKMERSRFPSALELITGKFLRHSPEFYEWRIKNRLTRLEKDPSNVLLLDDLAVAYDKTGKHDKAIETAERIEKIQPGRYETAANLATFLFHAGKIEESLPHVNRAITINPDAHFGREKYQKYLTEYVLSRKKKIPDELPLAEAGEPGSLTYHSSFAEHIGIKSNDGQWEERKAAIKGVLGMMRFANHESPVLLEALGSLLSDESHDQSDYDQDAKLLACRAFLKASYLVPEGTSRRKYRAIAETKIFWQRIPGEQIAKSNTTDAEITLRLAALEPTFKKELAEADAWYAELREREIGWIRDGLDPEVEFDKLYTTEPEVSGMDVRDPLTPKERLQIFAWSAGSIFTISIIAVIYFLWRRSKRRATQIP